MPGAGTSMDEFQNIPLDLIIVEKQIRTDARIDDKDSQWFVDSITAQGVIEPIIVTTRADKLLPLAGERR
jgi:ParB-like chromosome segregation protein Spo0J